jgi:hypothetical protein
MVWNKMDSIVIMEYKCIFYHNFKKIKGLYVKKMQEKMRPWRSIIIEKYNFNNKKIRF